MKDIRIDRKMLLISKKNRNISKRIECKSKETKYSVKSRFEKLYEGLFTFNGF